MGYPVSYRTSAARQERQLSRPDVAPAPIRPANDNYKKPTPANDNYKRPPVDGRWNLHPAHKRAAIQVLRLHPMLRWAVAAYDIYTIWKLNEQPQPVPTYGGQGLTLQCSVPMSQMCTDAVPCGDFSYCAGPNFAIYGGPSLCGLKGQAGGGNEHSVFPVHGTMDGVLVKMIRPGAPGCHPMGILRQYGTNAQYPYPRTRFPPQAVPYVTVHRPIYRAFRWYKPEIFMKPQEVGWDVPPLPPPYEDIPNRRDVDRGYSPPLPEPAAEPQIELAPRWRPPARTKEQKVKWSGATNILNAILVSIARVHGKLLDFRDIIQAMHDALPKEFQLKGAAKKRPQDLLEQLFRHWDKMNGEKALANIIKELAEDVVGGTGDRLRKEISENFGWFKTKTFTGSRF